MKNFNFINWEKLNETLFLKNGKKNFSKEEWRVFVDVQNLVKQQFRKVKNYEDSIEYQVELLINTYSSVDKKGDQYLSTDDFKTLLRKLQEKYYP